MSEVVYILGAGFSKCAGAPLQSKILEKIFDPSFNSIERGYDSFNQYLTHTRTFIYDLFSINKDEDLIKIELEDILTILDKAILNQEFIKNYSPQNLSVKRKELIGCILFMFNEKLRNTSSNFYSKLSQKIIAEKLSKDQKEDSIGFIYLNWDIILDNYLFINAEKNNIAEAQKAKEGKNYKPRFIHLDYCCYTTPFDMPNYTLSKHNLKSIDVKAKGFYNIKIQKLHGSFNWLLCNNCGRLFYKLGEKIALYEMFEINICPHCNLHTLKPIIITPTLLKDLNNTHLKMVWHNALLDLMEAKKVVFVGYSFPLADFELKYLLKKGISKNAEIEIVLSNSLDDKIAYLRYKNFFGNQIKKPLYEDGSQNYFSQIFDFELSKFDCKDNFRIVAKPLQKLI